MGYLAEIKELVKKYGIEEIARRMGITTRAIGYWTADVDPKVPTKKTQAKIHELFMNCLGGDPKKVFVSHDAADKPATTGQLLETINLLVRQNDKLADTNRILSEKIATIPVGDQSETQRSVDAMLQGLREFALKVSTGSRYKTLDDAREAYRKEFAGVQEKIKERDNRGHQHK